MINFLLFLMSGNCRWCSMELQSLPSSVPFTHPIFIHSNGLHGFTKLPEKDPCQQPYPRLLKIPCKRGSHQDERSISPYTRYLITRYLPSDAPIQCPGI